MSGLEVLRKIVLSKGVVNNKVGVVYVLKSKSSIYVGYEYEYNVEKQVKDLLVRARSYEELGYLYESSYEVLKNDKVELDIVVTSIIAHEGDGLWREYEGGYEDWKIQKARSDQIRANYAKPESKVESKADSKQAPKVEAKPAIKSGVQSSDSYQCQ